MKHLTLAPGLTLPTDEAVTQKYGFIGRSGSGKSYGSMKLAELFLGAGAQIIALDWVGIWWSLRLAAGAKAPGFEHVYIFGGEHADVELLPESGRLMADLIVDKHISVVLDVMHFRKAERTRFATAFAEQFFHRKKTARTACHLFIEEAQAYLPQMVRGDEARMVGVFEDIGKVGRNYGIGTTLISQRPQAINKDVLNQVEVLLAFQTNGPQERKAISGWTSENTAGAAAMMQELPGLPVGDALVWSPQWLRVAKRVHIAERTTYNASSTPTQQAKAIAPKRLAPADLDAIAVDLAATIEKAKADDPRELRKRIGELEAALKSKAKTGSSSVQAAEGKPVAVLTDADRELVRRLMERVQAIENLLLGEGALKLVAEYQQSAERALETAWSRFESLHHGARRDFAKVVESAGLARIVEKLDRVSGECKPVNDSFTHRVNVPARAGNPISSSRQLHNTNAAAVTMATRALAIGGGDPLRTSMALALAGAAGHIKVDAARAREQRAPVDDGVQLSGPQQQLLDAAAYFESVNIAVPSRRQLALVAKVSATSSGFEKNIGRLRVAGYVTYPTDGMVQLTETGRARAVAPLIQPTVAELQEALLSRVSGPQADLLRFVLGKYPRSVSRDDLAVAGNVSVTSSGFEKNLGTLRTLGLVTYPEKGVVKASSELFLEA